MMYDSPIVQAYVQEDAEDARQDGLDLLDENETLLSHDLPSINKV